MLAANVATCRLMRYLFLRSSFKMWMICYFVRGLVFFSSMEFFMNNAPMAAEYQLRDLMRWLLR